MKDASTQGVESTARPVENVGIPAYEPPRITWRELYAPLSFGLSCAKFSGVCSPPGPAKQ